MDITDMVDGTRNPPGRNVDDDDVTVLTKCADNARCSPCPRDCHRDEANMEERLTWSEDWMAAVTDWIRSSMVFRAMVFPETRDEAERRVA